MINTILRTIRDSIGTYMTHTTRWLVAAHYPFPMPNENTADRIEETPSLPCTYRSVKFGSRPLKDASVDGGSIDSYVAPAGIRRSANS